MTVLVLANIAARSYQAGSPTDVGWWIQQGGYAALLGLVLFWKRQDDQRYAADLKAMNERRAEDQKSTTTELLAMNGKLIDVLTANAKSLTEIAVKVNGIVPTTMVVQQTPQH